MYQNLGQRRLDPRPLKTQGELAVAFMLIGLVVAIVIVFVAVAVIRRKRVRRSGQHGPVPALGCRGSGS